VGSQQFRQWMILAKLAVEEQLDFLFERQPQVLIEIREAHRIGCVQTQITEVEPLAGEVFDQRRGPPIRPHPLDLLIEDRWRLESALGGDVNQLVVRNTAPQKERKPRGQLDV